MRPIVNIHDWSSVCANSTALRRVFVPPRTLLVEINLRPERDDGVILIKPF